MKAVRILGFVVIAIIVFFAFTDGLRKFGETDILFLEHMLE